MSDTTAKRYVYITFGVGTPLRNRYVRILTDRPDYVVAQSLFGDRYSSTYSETEWRGGAGWTELVLTGAVLNALRGYALPLDSEDDDTRACREHMAQDQASL